MNNLIAAVEAMKQTGGAVQITTTATELAEFGSYLIDQATTRATERIRTGADEVLLTVTEAMHRLQIKDRTTLYRWDKRGYLNPVRSGKKCLYKATEIDRLLISKAAQK